MNRRFSYGGLGLLLLLVIAMLMVKPVGKATKDKVVEIKESRKTPAQRMRDAEKKQEMEFRKSLKPQDYIPWLRLTREGRHEEAMTLLFDDLEKARSAGDDKAIYMAYKNIGFYNRLRGFYSDGLVFLDRALEVAENNDWYLRSAIIRKHIAGCYFRMYRFEDTLRELNIAREIFEEYNLDEYKAYNLLSIGQVYQIMLDYDRALSYYEKGLAIYERIDIPENVATFYRAVGNLHSQFGRFREAIKYLEKGLEVARTEDFVEQIAFSLRDIGYLYHKLGNHEEAETYLSQAEEGFGKAKFILEKQPHEVAALKYFQVENLLKTHRYADALSYLEDQGEDIYGAIADFHSFHRQKAEVLRSLRQEKDASLALLDAVSFVEETRWESIDKASRFFDPRLGGEKITPYFQLISLLSQRYLSGERGDEHLLKYGPDIASGAFYFSESIKARALLDTIAAGARNRVSASIPPVLKTKEQKLLAQLDAAQKNLQAVFGLGQEIYLRVKKRKDTVFQELQAFITQLRRSHPLYAFVRFPQPTRSDALPLEDNEALIEYAFTGEVLYIFLVKKGRPVQVFSVAEEAAAVAKMVAEFCRPFYRDPATGTLPYNEFSPEKGKALYDILLAEVLLHVELGDNLVIIPDSFLSLLPFEILVTDPGKTLADTVYVVDNWDLCYYQSASVMALNRMVERPRAQRTLFALGNPVYNDSDPRIGDSLRQLDASWEGNLDRFAFRGMATRREWGSTAETGSTGGSEKREEVSFAPLPESGQEVKNIAGIFKVGATAPDILLNLDANESTFRKSPLKDYRYLHFATHADVPGRVKGINEPFILLGQVDNREPDDGFLTLGEVANLELNADLVVLSACVTGLGAMQHGEGVANFAYAFHSAGAKSVVVTLWEVASLQAVEFMTVFYSRLSRGEPKARALFFARRQLREKYPNPFFWAPFVLHGERK